jgi:hypothetical protein
MEAPEWRTRSIQLTCGASQPPVGTTRGLFCPGCYPVGVRVGSRCPLDFEVVWVPMGSSIHVMSTSRHLICQGVAPLDW